jgi:hypothetical protein
MRFRRAFSLAVLTGFSALAIFVGCLGDDPEKVTPTPEAGGSSSGSSGTTTDANSPSPDGAGSSSGNPAADGGTAIALANSDFQNGCAEWEPEDSLVGPEDAGRSPTNSCLVCYNNSTQFDIVQRIARSDLQPGATFRARAYVRRPLQGNAAKSANIYLQAEDDQLNIIGRDTAPTVVMPLTNEWQLTESVVIVRDAGASRIGVYAVGEMALTNDGCFLVDDVTLVKE